MRTVVRVLMGLVAALLAAGVVTVAHVITPAELSGLSGDALMARLSRFAELAALATTQQALFVVPLALIAVTVAEINRLRGWLFYAALGAAIAAAGWYLQYATEDELRTVFNPYAAQTFAVDGVIAGLVYWLLAGRFAGWRRGGGLVKAQPFPIAKPRMQVSDLPATEGKSAKTKTN